MKSRMVTNGNEQNTDVYQDCSSPIVTIHSIFAFTLLYLKAAFIQMEVQGIAVYSKCQLALLKLSIKCLPGINKYNCIDGMFYCMSLQALYGCVQASKL